jgi:hypothetical protein
MSTIPMEVHDGETVSIDHFYVFDNVAVFPVTVALKNFSKFVTKIKSTGYDIEHNHRIVFCAVNSDRLITLEIFDSLQVFGVAILNLQTKAVDYFVVNDNNRIVQTRILDVIAHKFTSDLYMDINVYNPNFDIDANFFAKYGFFDPVLKGNVVRLKYLRRVPTKVTLMQIRSIVGNALGMNMCILNIFIPRVVAATLSKCVQFMNEASGNLSIVKYVDGTDGPIAIIGLNSDNIREGEIGNVPLPEEYSPLVFHSHPDKVTREYKAFISWPSGQDMMVVVLYYLQNKDQLVHFVSSPEGLWTIHITSQFQKILKVLKTLNKIKCGESILEAIHNVFTKFEYGRTIDIDPIERHNIGSQYLSATKNYKLSNLFVDVPSLQMDCNTEIVEDAQLFDVSLIKWKKFTETSDEGVFLTFDYIPDPKGGLAPIIFPY